MEAEANAKGTMSEWEALTDKERRSLIWNWKLRKHKRG
jgi:hypothetical protein